MAIQRPPCAFPVPLSAVIPAKAGIQLSTGSSAQSWTPAFAGVADHVGQGWFQLYSPFPSIHWSSFCISASPKPSGWISARQPAP